MGVLEDRHQRAGLYGLGSASNLLFYRAVIAGLEHHLIQWLIGKDPSRIEDLWQSGHVRSYWPNSTVNNALVSAVDEALWDIKGKRAGMPVYELVGGKAHDAVACYQHADAPTKEQTASESRQSS